MNVARFPGATTISGPESITLLPASSSLTPARTPTVLVLWSSGWTGESERRAPCPPPRRRNQPIAWYPVLRRRAPKVATKRSNARAGLRRTGDRRCDGGKASPMRRSPNVDEHSRTRCSWNKFRVSRACRRLFANANGRSDVSLLVRAHRWTVSGSSGRTAERYRSLSGFSGVL